MAYFHRNRDLSSPTGNRLGQLSRIFTIQNRCSVLGCAQQGGLECQERLSQIIHFPIMLGCMSPIIDNIAWERSIHQQKHTGILLISPNSQSKKGSFRFEGMRLNKAKKCMVEGSEAGRVIGCQRKKSSSKMISWEQKHIVLTSCGNGAP